LRSAFGDPHEDTDTNTDDNNDVDTNSVDDADTNIEVGTTDDTNTADDTDTNTDDVDGAVNADVTVTHSRWR